MTNREAYAQSLGEALTLLESIGDELESHRQANSVNPLWPAIGDLKHVAALLGEVYAFNRQRQPEP